MRKALIITVLAFVPFFLSAQGGAIEKLIKKYSGQQGVTVVNLGPELFQMVTALGIDEIEKEEFPVDKINSLQVLTIEDNEKLAGVDFYAELEKDLDLDDYAEIITVVEADEQVRMWMKADGKTISKFLLIVSGDEPTLVYISGNFNLNDLEGITDEFDLDVDIDEEA